MIVFVIAVFLSVASAINAATITADSTSQADVQDAVSSAEPGDTVLVPAGTSYWTAPLYINTNISVIGAGIGLTVIVDEVGRGSGHAMLVVMQSSGSQLTRLSGFTFRGGVTNTASVQDGTVIVSGKFTAALSSARIDHCLFENLYNVGVMFQNDTFGVVDHCQIYNTHFYNGIVVYTGAAYGDWADGCGGQGYGDKSWSLPAEFGTADRNVYVEDCHFWWPTTSPMSAMNDLGNGGRVVFRYNMITNEYFQTHGTESGGRRRGGRQFEIYGNTFVNADNTGAQTPVSARSGTGLVYSNTYIGFASSPMTFNCYRDSDKYDPWGSANGQNGWDSNNPIAVVTGTMSGGTNGQYWLTDTNANWTPGEFVPGYVLQNVTHGGTNTGAYSLILSNDAHRIWYQLSVFGSGHQMLFDNGDDYAVYQVYVRLDQIGWGQGDLIQDAVNCGNGTPSNTVTHALSSWPHQVNEPVYLWENQKGDGTPMPAGENIGFLDLGYATQGLYNSIILNRDYTNGVAPGYTPLAYPHPLISGEDEPRPEGGNNNSRWIVTGPSHIGVLR